MSINNNYVAIMAGGTGLYIKAFCEGLDDIPSIDPAIRNNIITVAIQYCNGKTYYTAQATGWGAENRTVGDRITSGINHITDCGYSAAACIAIGDG